MITLKEFMEITNYRITEGSDFCWDCFGPNAYRLDSWDGDQDGHTISIVFDTQTQDVYTIEAFDYRNERAYRMINPEFKPAHDAEVSRREQEDIAWEKDDGTPLKFIDLDVDDDFIQKALAIVAGEDYDTRVQIEVDFSDAELLEYMTLAHKLDITFNDLVERAVKEAIDAFQADPSSMKAKVEQWKQSR